MIYVRRTTTRLTQEEKELADIVSVEPEGVSTAIYINISGGHDYAQYVDENDKIHYDKTAVLNNGHMIALVERSPTELIKLNNGYILEENLNYDIRSN